MTTSSFWVLGSKAIFVVTSTTSIPLPTTCLLPCFALRLLTCIAQSVEFRCKGKRKALRCSLIDRRSSFQMNGCTAVSFAISSESLWHQRPCIMRDDFLACWGLTTWGRTWSKISSAFSKGAITRPTTATTCPWGSGDMGTKFQQSFALSYVTRTRAFWQTPNTTPEEHG